MDNKIKYLFEYQKFDKNSHLENVIDSCKTEKACELSDESLFAAAGGEKKEENFPKEKNTR